ncbi:MAG: ABC transporter permease [Actinomycetota bacterium]
MALRERGPQLKPSSLHAGDLIRVGAVGLLSRRVRAALSALGIAIGIGAMVGVLGISESSKADLLSSLDRLGTNLLTVEAGSGIGGGTDNEIPETAIPMMKRIGPVEQVASVTPVDAAVLRNEFIPEDRTGGLSVKAADLNLVTTLAGSMADGVWLNAESSRLPTVVLGSVAAERLGITSVDQGARVWLGEQWFTVVGILNAMELAADVDRSVLIGQQVAEEKFDTSENPGTVYLRTDPEQVIAVRDVLAATANPDNPDQVDVSRPSDAIEARAAAATAFTGLFLGLGAVALLVGGVGIANVMVISVLERRGEIGLRRALGATRRHVSTQFLSEAVLLSLVGGTCGVMLGAGVTAVYCLIQGWSIVVPLIAIGGGVVAAVLIGAIAGVYPARRASRLSPTEALRAV